ncbi:MAG: hypothetical protein J6B54_06085 [Clostridia bacterium]|nr:hypothetical protein [Clostridia bacterium]
MPDLFSKISEILSNPESAQKIREIASTLSTSDLPSPAPSVPEESEDGIPDVPALPASAGLDTMNLLSSFSGGGTHSRDLALLHAVRPYLRASRAGKIDNAIKAIRVIDLLTALR